MSKHYILDKSNIEDNLASDSATQVLSAKQGKVLENRVGSVENEVDDLNQRVGNVDISDIGSSCTDAIKNLTPTIIDGDFIVETVPASTVTVVANVTLQPGTYIIIGHVSFSASFGQAFSLQFGNLDNNYAVYSTGDNGGGIEVTTITTLNARRIVQLRAYQNSGSNKTLDSDCELRAIKLA